MSRVLVEAAGSPNVWALPSARICGGSASTSTSRRPFAAAVDAGLPLLMSAHVVHAAIDPVQPGTLSPAIAASLLRPLNAAALGLGHRRRLQVGDQHTREAELPNVSEFFAIFVFLAAYLRSRAHVA